MKRYGYHRCYHGKPGDGLIGLLIILALYLMAMPFVGAYKLATGKDENSKVVGSVMLIAGILIYLIALLNS